MTNNNPTTPDPMPRIDDDAEPLAHPDAGDLTPPHGDIRHRGEDDARESEGPPPKRV
jgi:hypothetical protein